MVSPDGNIPLFHEAYPGNMNDAQQFSSIISKLKDRYRKLGRGDCDVTLVFDKGSNNEDNIQELVNVDPCPFRFVGGLRLSQCPELLDVPKSDFVPLSGDFHGATAYRSGKNVYGKDFTAVVTNNPVLYEAQMVGVLLNIANSGKALAGLQERLRLRKEGTITKGKKPTTESVGKNIKAILSAEYMYDIFDCTVTSEPDQTPELEFSLNNERLAALKERSLGKTILFTDRREWSNEQIVTAYRSQYHVEEAFKQMKDTAHISFRPLRHFTDANIRVHAFYCVLAYMLAALLNRELKQMGHNVSINRMLDKFQEAQQVISVFNQASGKKPVVKTAYSRFEGIARDYDKMYDLLKYLN